MPDPPQTDEGWFVLHDFRSVDWDAWREAPEDDRDRAIETGVEYLADAETTTDADEGVSAVCSVLGDKADLLFFHLRPTLDALSALERRLETTPIADYLDRTASYVSVTEVSGYVSDDYFAENDTEVDDGLRRYIEGKLHPELPDSEYVCFYPMSKRRGEAHNWYTLSLEERAEMMAEHGESGRKYGGKIHQIVASSVGFDDHEWGVTLFGSDPVDIKEIVYEMRFDEATAKYGEFGRFYVGRRFPADDLGAYLAGERVPTAGHEVDAGRSTDHGETTDGASPHGDTAPDADTDDIRARLADLDVYAGQPHGEDVYATAVYSTADPDDLFEEVEGLRGNFDHYDTHVETAVYESRNEGPTAAVSLWETASAAETAAGFLADLPGVVARVEAGEDATVTAGGATGSTDPGDDAAGSTDADDDATAGFGTMGMFYTVQPDHREDFHERFDEVLDLLDGTDGHRETRLLVNREDDCDMFVASEWRSREDAMAFFGSEEFRDTVEWGREVLADRPRHVFLA